MKLTLNSAELVLLLAAMRLDARAFITDGPMTMQDGARLAEQLDRARRSLFDRKLATIEPHRGLVPTSSVRAMLTRAAKAAPVRSTSTNRSARISICQDGDQMLLHAALPDGMHVFTTERNTADAIVGMIDAATRRSMAIADGLLATRHGTLRWMLAPGGGWLVRPADSEGPARLFDRAGFAAHVTEWLSTAQTGLRI